MASVRGLLAAALYLCSLGLTSSASMPRGAKQRQPGPAPIGEVQWATDMGYEWNGLVWVCTGCAKEPQKARMEGHSRACPALHTRRENQTRQAVVCFPSSRSGSDSARARLCSCAYNAAVTLLLTC